MSTEFRLPQLGDGVDKGVVVKVLVGVGDTVAKDQSVLEVETNKAIADVPSDVEGVVEAVRVGEGDEIAPGDVVFTVQVEAGDTPAEAPAGPGSEETPAPQEPQDLRPNEQRAVEVSPPAEPLESASSVPPREPAAPTAESRTDGTPIPAAPSTRRFAREIGVDITAVEGSGPGGRISIDDVKAYARASRAAGGVPQTAAVPLPDFSRWGEVERVPLQGIRRVTAHHMSEAWASIPHVTQFDRADVTDLEAFRKRYGPQVERAGGKLTPTAVILKVVAGALRRFPNFNSSVDMASDEIVLKRYIHIGVAVDTEHGLLVPVIRDVDRKSIVQLCVELGEIAEKARNRRLTSEEMEGGTFTVSNLGGIGGTGFTPIVNAPEVAILGVARSGTEPVYEDGAFVPRTIMPLSLSYDHRVIDGADGARFLRWIAEALEQPFLLMLEG